MRRARELGLTAIAIVATLCRPSASAAQWWDAQSPERGELLVGLSGQNITVDHRFGPSGERQALSDVFAAGLDARLVPALDTLDAALAGFFPSLGLAVPGPSTLGRLRYDVLLERTRAPITVAFGATGWLSLFAVIPIVKGQSFVRARLDSLSASAGAAGGAFSSDPDAFFQNLDAAIASLEATLAADTLTAELQAQAQRLLADARTLEAGLSQLRQQPYLPTDSSPAGRQLSGFYQALQTGFQGFQIELPSLALAPPLDAGQAASLASGPEFGIEALRNRSTGIRLGDIEAGISVQPLNTFRRPARARPWLATRVRLDALYRFASGAPPAPSRPTDVGTGDGQPDVELRGTLDLAFGRRFWLSLATRYNLQLESRLERLVTSPEFPIQPGARSETVRWDPGDVLTIAAVPRFNFTSVITLSGLLTLTHRGRDAVRAGGVLSDEAAFVPADLERGTRFTAKALGFAVRYSSTHWHGGRRSGTPVEVELSYLRTTSAQDGLAPQQNVWRVALRYYRAILR